MKLFKKQISFEVEDENARIKVLGSGCSKCNTLEEYTKQALIELNINETLSHVKDYSKIASYGVMSTPALVVNEKVVLYGKVGSVEEIKEILKKEYINE